MKRRKATTHKRRAVSRRRHTVHRNPTVFAKARRKVSHARKAFSGGTRNFLGELASKDGMILLASAAAAPAAVNFIADKIVPVQYRAGWTGIAAKAGITVGLAYLVDRFAKQRKAAIGIAAGGLGVVIADAVNFYRVSSTISAAPVAVQDQISKNPAMMAALIDGDYSSLNGYQAVPMAGYDNGQSEEGYEALN